MPLFSILVQLKGMNAFVPNSSYNEVMALMVNPQGHHHDPAEPHLPHHLYLVFDCRELEGCNLQSLPPGFEPYPNPLGRPEWKYLVRYKLLGGYDIHFLLLPGEQEMSREDLKIKGLSNDVDNGNPPQTLDDFRRTVDLERLLSGAGRIKEGLVTLPASCINFSINRAQTLVPAAF